MSSRIHAARLMRIASDLEQTIVLLERRRGPRAQATTRRLRLLQGEILAAQRLLEGDFSRRG
jgi:hypothetical protein